MNRNMKGFIVGLGAVILVLLLCSPVMAQQKVTITGTITAGYEIEDDEGQVYEIGDNEKGEELTEYVDMRVSVTGILEEEDEIKIIMVTSFKVLEE